MDDLNYINYAQTKNLIESATYADLSVSIVFKELTSNYKIVKGIALLFLVVIFNYIFTYEKYKDDSNYKLYIILFAFCLMILIYLFDLYFTLIIIVVVLIFTIPPIVILYYYIRKQEAIIKFFYSYNNQVNYVFGNNFNSVELIFNILFISIIFILSIVLYWDNIYSGAKKLSKCGRILTIIENNTYKKKPYVYNIIILDNNSLNTKVSNHIIKITYDFMKMKTSIEYNKNNSIIYSDYDGIRTNYENELKKRSDIITNIRNDLFTRINPKITDFTTKMNTYLINGEDATPLIITKLENIIRESLLVKIKEADVHIEIIKAEIESLKKSPPVKYQNIIYINTIIKYIIDKIDDDEFKSLKNLYLIDAKLPEEQNDMIFKFINKYNKLHDIPEKRIILKRILNYVYTDIETDEKYKKDKQEINTKIDNTALKEESEINAIFYDIIKSKKLEELASNIKTYHSKLYENRKRMNYFNLQNMSIDTIENIDSEIITDTEEKYKYLCVDENNKPIYDYSCKELSTFTKKYAVNPDYIPNIIYDIIYAKINNNRVFV